jgi:aspartate/tyrosine/aromatic aminotransferase
VWLQQFTNEEKGIDRDQVSKIARALYARPAAADAGVSKALLNAGAMLANAAYNIHSMQSINRIEVAHVLSLKEAQEAWDAALAAKRGQDNG